MFLKGETLKKQRNKQIGKQRNQFSSLQVDWVGNSTVFLLDHGATINTNCDVPKPVRRRVKSILSAILCALLNQKYCVVLIKLLLIQHPCCCHRCPTSQNYIQVVTPRPVSPKHADWFPKYLNQLQNKSDLSFLRQICQNSDLILQRFSCFARLMFQNPINNFLWLFVIILMWNVQLFFVGLTIFF